jgi:hypothetical protein
MIDIAWRISVIFCFMYNVMYVCNRYILFDDEIFSMYVFFYYSFVPLIQRFTDTNRESNTVYFLVQFLYNMSHMNKEIAYILYKSCFCLYRERREKS